VSLSPYYADDQVTLHLGHVLDVLPTMAAASIDAVVTSPPYWGLRDYGHPEQWGNEPTVEEYVDHLRALFGELRRVLVPTGAVWLNLGDSYSNNSDGYARGEDFHERQPRVRSRARAVPHKSLVGVPWRVALALQQDGWAVRNAVVWHKPNPMPHPVKDRLVNAYEHVFLLAPVRHYHFDLDPVREALKYPDGADGSSVFGGRQGQRGVNRTTGHNTYGKGHPEGQPPQQIHVATGSRHTGGNPAGRNPGDVWTIATQPTPDAHFATMPTELARRLILTTCPEGGTVLDPFNGRGTTGRVARLHDRRYVGIDINPAYLDLTVDGIAQGVLV
jgi:DNA modification methylase